MSTRQDDDSRGPTTRVLVLEDSDAIRESVVDALADAGHVTEGVVDGVAFEERLAAFRPDLVVLDVMLPGGRVWQGYGRTRPRNRAAALLSAWEEEEEDCPEL